MRIVGILLAAGAATRFGGAKLLAALPDGTPVGVRACANLLAVLPETIAVIRPGADALRRALEAAGAVVSVCEEARSGMGASLAHAARAAGDADAVVVALADMPWIQRSSIDAVTGALECGEQLVVPRHAGRRGHPVGFGRRYFPQLTALRDDQGARDIIAVATTLCSIELDDAGILRDVDTKEDLATPQSR